MAFKREQQSGKERVDPRLVAPDSRLPTLDPRPVIMQRTALVELAFPSDSLFLLLPEGDCKRCI